MSATRSLDGRVVAITGGARGIGAATARTLAERGARVAIGDVDVEAARAAAADIGRGVVALPVDVTDPASFDAFLDGAERDLGPLDVLVNNAGVMPLSRLLDEDEATTARILDVNVRAVVHGTREAVRRMLPRGSGHVVNIASTAGKAGVPGASTYCASKYAVVGFSESAWLELRGTGVEVSCVMPGIVRTELTDGVEDMPLFRAVQPDDVAAAIAGALERPRFEVYVPASAGRLIASTALLPRSARVWIARRMGVDRVFLDAADRPERTAYEQRARGR